uniref:Uncharacterized protein n=1 Tax=Lepeophtheirus salmonis TaxID=72036 RepID=A0A0K2VKH9_LEPSM
MEGLLTVQVPLHVMSVIVTSDLVNHCRYP